MADKNKNMTQNAVHRKNTERLGMFVPPKNNLS